MFTGIVEEIGTVEAIELGGESARLSIRGPLVVSDAQAGDSISVNGCCLTVAEFDGDVFTADVMAETLSKTSLGELKVSNRVNLERAVAAGARLGGHIVQGHVDATATLLDRTSTEHWDVLRFSLPARLTRYVVNTGSIAVAGTSLTVVELGHDNAGDGAAGASEGSGGWFTVSLIPTTLKETILGQIALGDTVNIEVDVIAKYVERMVSS